MITIIESDQSTFRVTVEDLSNTKHEVTLTDEYHQNLTSGKISKKELIKISFEFLLKRESNTMIMSRFDLPVINRYFPEYETAIKRGIRE